MAKTSILSFHLREQAKWRDAVAVEHADFDSDDAASALRAAADYVDGVGDSDPNFEVLVRAGWLLNGEFRPNDAAKEYLRRYGYRRVCKPRDLLFGLACCADANHTLVLKQSLQGLAAKQGLKLVALRSRDTHRPAWESYALVTPLGVTQVEETTLLGAQDYLLKSRPA